MRAIADATGASTEDVNDQIDILDDLGAVNSDRRIDGDAAPRITGAGKLLLEELDDELRESKPDAAQATQTHNPLQWDVFICHASEDKESFVRPLAKALREHCSVWYDEFSLKVGDSLRRKIDEGLAGSRFGVVVLSPSFFAKQWPQDELDGLDALEKDGRKVILPVWLDIDRDGVAKHSPLLVGRVAAQASDGLMVVVQKILDAMGLQLADDEVSTGDASHAPSTSPAHPTVVDDPEPNRPRFEVDFGGAKTLEANFEPRFTLRQFSGDPVPDLQCRIRGPRLHGMEWEPTTGGQLERTAFIHAFDLTEPQGEDHFVEESQMGFEVRFRWRRAWRSEIHLWPISRDDLGYKVLWRIGSKILPPLLIDDSVE